MEEWIQIVKVGIRNKSQRRDQLLSTSSRKTSLTWHSIHQRAWQLTHVFIPYFSESWTIFLPLLWLYNPKNPFSQIREPFIAFFRARNKLSRVNSAFRLLLHLHWPYTFLPSSPSSSSLSSTSSSSLSGTSAISSPVIVLSNLNIGWDCSNLLSCWTIGGNDSTTACSKCLAQNTKQIINWCST